MKSFYILPYVLIHANVFFDTEKEANDFIEQAKQDCRYLSAHLTDPYAGSFIVSVNYEEYSNKKFLVTLADEDLFESMKEYFKDAWPATKLPKNWEVYEEVAMVKCMVECSECGEEFEMDLCDGDFFGMLYRNTVKNKIDDFKFLCNKCYDSLNNYEFEPMWFDF